MPWLTAHSRKRNSWWINYPHDQVRLLAYLTTRLAQVVTALDATVGGTPPETSDVWETFFQLGEMLATTDTPERETLTAAVLAMRR
jgi:hypothetical protein